MALEVTSLFIYIRHCTVGLLPSTFELIARNLHCRSVCFDRQRVQWAYSGSIVVAVYPRPPLHVFPVPGGACAGSGAPAAALIEYWPTTDDAFYYVHRALAASTAINNCRLQMHETTVRRSYSVPYSSLSSPHVSATLCHELRTSTSSDVRGGCRHVQHVRPNRGPAKRGLTGQRMSDNSATFCGLWGLFVARCNI